MLDKLMFGIFKKKKKTEIVDPTEEKAKKELERLVRDVDNTKELKEKIFDDAVKFEIGFYGVIADYGNFKVLITPDKSNKTLTDEEVKEVKKINVKKETKLIYQIDIEGMNGKTGVSLVFGPYTGLTGVVYPTDETGFHA